MDRHEKLFAAISVARQEAADYLAALHFIQSSHGFPARKQWKELRSEFSILFANPAFEAVVEFHGDGPPLTWVLMNDVFISPPLLETVCDFRIETDQRLTYGLAVMMVKTFPMNSEETPAMDAFAKLMRLKNV